MAEITDAQITQAVGNIKKAFEDGFQPGDINVLLKEITSFAGVFELTGAEKKELALRVAGRVLDETDIPWFPDKLSLPMLGEVGADALIMKALPGLIDLLFEGINGEFNPNEAGDATAS